MAFEIYSGPNYDVIEIEEVNRKYQIAAFAKDDDGKIGTSMIDRVDNKIKTIIYTDGKVINIEKSEPIPISEYFIDKKKYNYEVNQLVKKRLYIEDATYIVKVNLAEEILDFESRGRKGRGNFYVITSSELLVKDKKDKEAIRKAKETVKSIKANSREFNSAWDVLFKKKANNESTLEYESTQEDIYQLKSRTR